MSAVKTKMVQRIEAEHNKLKQEIEKIQQMMSPFLPKLNYTDWHQDFLWLLRDFNNDLQKHFDLEEEGGFMQDILDTDPRFVNTIDRLEAEHETMGQELDKIIHHLKDMSDYDAKACEMLFAEIAALLEMLHAHEAAESEVIESTYLDDLGGGD